MRSGIPAPAQRALRKALYGPLPALPVMVVPVQVRRILSRRRPPKGPGGRAQFMDDPETRSLEERLHEAQECALRLDQSREELFSRLRDAEDARKAAVAVIQRQNEAIARVRAVHRMEVGLLARNTGICAECGLAAPCSTLKALNA